MSRLHQRDVENMVVESHRLKMTPQRRAIIEYLQAAIHHPTAEEVLRAVNEKFPMTSRATVYNTLNWLKGEGMVKEMYEGGLVRFDPNTSDHHHFVCRRCGRVEDVESELIGNYQIDPLPGNHTVENFEVILRGICADCQGN
jgi:Fur family transcriptional regulator, peroxide stress response regulator